MRAVGEADVDDERARLGVDPLLPDRPRPLNRQALLHPIHIRRIGVADGMPIARVWACR